MSLTRFFRRGMQWNSTMKKFYLLLIPVFILLASCSSEKKVVDLNVKYIPTDRTPGKAIDKQAQAQIAEAAISIGQSLQELSAVQMTEHPPRKLPSPYNPNVIGMGKMASLDWTGPVEPVLQKIAVSTHYQLRVIGRKPIIPVFISVDVNNEPIADILRDITYQVVTKATIALYPRSRTIELRYHGN